MLISMVLVFLGLVVVFYLRTQGTARQQRLLLIIASGFLAASFLGGISAIALEGLLDMPRTTLFIPLWFLWLAVGTILGNWLSKKAYKDDKEEELGEHKGLS